MFNTAADSINHADGFLYFTEGLFALWPVKTAIAAVAAFFSTDSVLIYVFLAFLIADFVTGILAAIARKHFSCRIFARGILKLPVYCFYVLMVGAVDLVISKALGGFDVHIIELFIAYLTANDGLSIIQNMGKLGFNVPPILNKFFKSSTTEIESKVDLILDKKDKQNSQDK